MKLYNIILEIRDKNENLFEHPKTGMFTGFKFLKEFKDYNDMELEFRSMHGELKMLMPKNTFYITASIKNTVSDTWTQMASLYGPEERFVIFN